MIKRVLGALLIFTQLLVFTNVNATTFHNYLPGGKNYIDILNVDVSNNVLSLKNPIKVLPSQTYTLSMPSDDMLGYGMYIIIEGEVTYIDDGDPFVDCDKNGELIICTFTTSEYEEYLTINIYGDTMNQYYQYYGIDNIQLEEGSVVTDYEPYISPYIDSTSPLFSGSGAYITSYNSVTTIDDIIEQHLAATDEIDGDISDQIQIVSDSFTANKGIIGEYLVELSVSDSSNNIAYFDLYVIVKDEINPYINSQDDIYLDVNDHQELTDIISQYVHYGDDYDTVLSLNVVIDQYTENKDQIGIYQVNIVVEDQSGNNVNKDIYIHVEDNDSPVMLSSTNYELNIDDETLVETIINEIECSDNYDDIVLIEIINDGYSENKVVLGTYFVDIVLKDLSGNEKFVTLEIVVKDYTSPIITGPSSISFSYENLKSISDIKNLFIVDDNISLLTINDLYIVEDTYSIRTSKTGDYYVILGLIDESGNVAQYNVDITVYDDVKPIILIDGYIIVVDQNTTFTNSDMMKLLSLSGELSPGTYEFEVLKNEYIGHEDIVGDYSYKIKIKMNNGDEITKDFIISVEENIIESSNLRSFILYGSALLILIGVIVYVKRK